MAETGTTSQRIWKRLTIQEPTWKHEESASQVQRAILLRIKNKFGEAEKVLEEVRASEVGENEELQIGSVWLANQIFKTQF